MSESNTPESPPAAQETAQEPAATLQGPSESPSLAAWLWTFFALLTIAGMVWLASDKSEAPHTPLRWEDILPQDHTPLHNWQYVVIHHSGAEVGDTVGIDRYHQSKGWEGIGYHFVIGNGHPMAVGRVEWSFRWNLQRHGAHVGVGDMNKKAIGICLVGNYDLDQPLSAQYQRAVELTALLISHIPTLSLDRVLGHGEVDGTNTHCPGNQTDMDAFRADVARKLNQPTIP